MIFCRWLTEALFLSWSGITLKRYESLLTQRFIHVGNPTFENFILCTDLYSYTCLTEDVMRKLVIFHYVFHSSIVCKNVVLYPLLDALSSYHWSWSITTQTWVPEDCLQPRALRNPQSAIPLSSVPNAARITYTLSVINWFSNVYLHYNYRQQHGRTFNCFQTAAFSRWLGPFWTGFVFGRRVKLYWLTMIWWMQVT